MFILQRWLKRYDEFNNVIILNILGAFACKAGTILISLLLFPAYMHFFQNNTVLGVWFTILSVLNWILIFDLGLGNGLRNKLPEIFNKRDFNLAKRYISTTYISTIILTLILFILFIILYPHMEWNRIFNIEPTLIPNNVLSKCVLIVFSGILLQFILKIITSILYALQKAAFVNTLGLITNLIILIIVKMITSNDIVDSLITMSYVNVIAVNIPMLLISVWIFRSKLRGLVPSVYYFDKKCCSEILGIGLTLLWLQVIFLVIADTHEFFISFLTTPNDVVNYQAYFKIFNTGAVIFSLALTPIWSAVTKAQSEKNYKWIKKTYKFFLLACLGCLLLELLLLPFTQFILDFWLGKNVIVFNWVYGVIFAISSFIFIVHNVNTSIGNGLSFFHFQMIGMTIAAIIDFPLAYYLVKILNSWIGVIIAYSMSVLFYELLAPYFTFKYINSYISTEK